MALKNDTKKMYIFQLYVSHPFELILCSFSEFSLLFLGGKQSWSFTKLLSL